MNTFITYDKTGGEICNFSMLKYKLIMSDKMLFSLKKCFILLHVEIGAEIRQNQLKILLQYYFCKNYF